MNCKTILVGLGLTLATTAANGATTHGVGAIYPVNATGEEGETIELEIKMNFADVSTGAFQFDLLTPEGITIGTNAAGKPDGYQTDRAVDHILSTSLQTDGEARYHSYTPTLTPYNGVDGTMVKIPLTLNVEPGEYTVTVKDAYFTGLDYNDYWVDDASATITVIPKVEKPYGDNQLYVLDMNVNQGETAIMSIGYNSLSDVYEYSADITLPAGVAATAVTFDQVVARVENFNNNWTFTAPVLKVNGAYGGGRRDVPAEGGDQVIATATIDTSTLSPGTYSITVGNQFLSNNTADYNPEAYTATLVVNALVQCETPEITINNDGHIVATCATEGAKLHTTVTCSDIDTFHHDSGEPVEMKGQYLITSYASADGKADSEPAKAMLVWAKKYDTTTEVDVFESSTERALLISAVGENFVVRGTVNKESILLYDLGGTLLYEGVAADGATTIPVSLSRNTVYVIVVADRSVKCTL